MSANRLWTGLALAAGIGAVVYLLMPADDEKPPQPIAVSLPAAFSARASQGEGLFNKNCAAAVSRRLLGLQNPEGRPIVDLRRSFASLEWLRRTKAAN